MTIMIGLTVGLVIALPLLIGLVNGRKAAEEQFYSGMFLSVLAWSTFIVVHFIAKFW